MAKVRVYELAKELGMESKSLLTILKDRGEFVRSASSTIEPAVVRKVREEYAHKEPVVVDQELVAKPAARSGADRLFREELSFCNRGLSELPEFGPQHRNVRVLDLNGNHMRVLPESIGYLENVEVIFAGGIGLVELPASISKLTRLRVLDIDRNQLTNLPDALARLPYLEVVDASKNQISDLAPEFGNALRRGVRLNLDSNPLIDPLPTLFSRGTDAVVLYLSSRKHASKELYESRVLLVGTGNVGKTSLVASLKGEAFQVGRETTHGMEITSLDVDHPRKDARMTLSLWDFGGQEVYRVTHQFFYSPRSLYIVVWKTREGWEANDVEAWMRRIRIRAGQDVRIILVATHGDERRPELDFPRMQRIFGPALVANCVVDNRSGSGIPELMRTLQNEAAELPQMGLLIGTSWVSTMQEVRKLSLQAPQIDYETYFEVAENAGSVGGEEADAILALMHDLGHVVYFSDDLELRDLVVLNPEWLTKAIGYVLEDAPTRQNGGVLHHSRLGEIWGSAPGKAGYDRRFFPYFLKLMEKFDVSYRLEGEEASLVGQLTPWERPVLPWASSSEPATGDRRVRAVFRLAEPAPGIIAWLTVRNHAHSIGAHWRHGVFLRHPNAVYRAEALIELVDDTHLMLEARAPSPDFYLAWLREGIEYLLKTRWPGLEYVVEVPCPTRTDVGPCPGLFSLEGLLRRRDRGRRKYPCLSCDEEHSISELLTGFSEENGSLEEQMRALSQDMRRLQGDVRDFGRVAGESAAVLGTVVGALSTEVVDCPRLFSLISLGDSRARTHVRVEVTLWCERPDCWHPCEGRRYEVDQPKEWFARLAPYARLVARALKIAVPIAGATVGALLPDEVWDDASRRVELANEVANALPGPIDSKKEWNVPPGRHLAPSEGEGLRAFRAMLFDADPARSFAGLRRHLTQTGEYIWVCPSHYEELNPGLPTIP